ncbi:MAG: NapC/NirT family cytochrome c, partial [Ectothiorhodospiraceae bacterium]
PALSATLIFGFSLPYLLASVITRRGHFLYATMLLGAVAYFLTCHALGAPAVFFPALSVPLVLALFLVGRYLEKKLGENLADFPRTVYRAMHITVAVFTGWALKQAPGTLASSGPAAYVSSFTCVAFAAVYLAHFAGGAHVLYAYVVSAFLLTGAVLGGAAVWPVTFWWMPAAVAAAVVLLLGARFHRLRGHRVGRHFYVGGGAALLVSLALALAHWPFFLLALSLGSLFLWMTYRKLEGMTREVRRAKMAERVLGKVFFLGSLVLMIPVGVMIFALPLNAMVGAGAVVCGTVMAWMTARRERDLFWGRNLYALGAGLFLSAGLFGLATLLPEASAAVVAVALPALFLVGMAGLDKRVEAMGRSWKGLGEAAVFPALFAWYVPLLAMGAATGLTASLAALLTVGIIAAARKGRGFLLGIGPAAAGALTCAALLYATGPALWMVPLGGAILAAVCYAMVEARGAQMLRNASSLAWLVLSIAAAIVAGFAGATELLYCATAIGFVAVALAGRREQGWDLYELMIAATAVLAGALAIALGPVSEIGPTGAGACLVALGAACTLSWICSGRDRFAQMAGGILALGTILVIFGVAGGITARIALGAAVPAVLFVLAGLARKGRPDVARSLESVGHAAGTALALAALILASRQTPAGLALAMVPYGLLYTLMPGLKNKEVFRFGAGAWASLAVLFAATGYVGGVFHQQAPLMAWLAVIWLGLGYLGRARWSSALYALSALLAVAAGAANVHSATGAHTWWVYLVTGSVFTALFVLRREDIFAYLLTLSLTLLTYDWVKASTSGFTQDVLFYLVIGVLVMGTFFLLPYLKRLLERGPALPMISIFTWRGAALAAVPVTAGAMLLLSVYSVKLTEHPKFCVSCHYMGEYYESWQHSSHQDVACVKCHYEPGVQAEVKGKMEGMVQFVKYVSHAYSTKPHAQISNSACMREGCHAGMDHSKQA